MHDLNRHWPSASSSFCASPTLSVASFKQTDWGLSATGTILLQECPPWAPRPMGASESIEECCLVVRGRAHMPFIVSLVTQIPLKPHSPSLLEEQFKLLLIWTSDYFSPVYFSIEWWALRIGLPICERLWMQKILLIWWN